MGSPLMRVATWNIHGLGWKDKGSNFRKCDSISSGRGQSVEGFLEKHTAVVFADTKNQDKDARFFTHGTEHHAVADKDGNRGVTIWASDELKYESDTLGWNIPDNLRHRFIGVKFSLPIGTEGGNGTQRLFFWLVGVYNHTSNEGSAVIKNFYKSLNGMIDIMRRDQPICIVAGDFNGVLNHQTDVHNPTRPAVLYESDRELLKFKVRNGFTDGLNTIAHRDTRTHYTFASRRSLTDSTDITKRVIDHIFCTTTQGVRNLIIDSAYSNPLGITHRYSKNWFSDHIPVTMEINLDEWECAYLPELYHMPGIFKMRFPENDSEEYKTFVTDLANIGTDEEMGTALELGQIKKLIEPNVFQGCTTKEEIDQNAQVLTDILGKHLVGKYGTVYKPGDMRHRGDKWYRHLVKSIEVLETFIHLINTCGRDGLGETSDKMDQMMAGGMATFKSHRHKMRLRGLQDGLKGVRRIYRTHPKIINWLHRAAGVLAELQTDLKARLQELRKDNTRQFLERYRKESSRFTKAFRSMVYKRMPTVTSGHFTENGVVHSGAAGRGVFERFYKKLTGAQKSEGDIEDLMREFVEGVTVHLELEEKEGEPWITVRMEPEITVYDKVKPEVHRRSKEVLKRTDRQEVVKAIMSSANKAPNPNDGVDYRTLKEMIKLIGKGDEEGMGDPESRRCALNSAAIIDNIVDLYNIILDKKHFPPAMNNGVICPLYKCGDVDLLSNYRPITLLPVLYRVLTKILNSRMLRIVDEVGAISHVQAGLGGGMCCHTQVNTFVDTTKHSHRHGKELYIMSTDVRKAFDTVDFSAFTYSLKAVGFSQDVVDLIDNLQGDFICKVRTPAGSTNDFTVGRGCKQGCSLSPLRFVLVYDMFLKYMERKGNRKGYKRELRAQRTKEGESTLNIPGCALADDMLVLGGDREEFVETMGAFDRFLRAVGLSINSSKCHYTTVGVEDPPAIYLTDHVGVRHRVGHKCNLTPVKYLGHLIVPGDVGHSIHKQWKMHNEMVYRKLEKACARLATSSCRATEVPHMMNSDVMSVLPYFCYLNHIPRSAVSYREQDEADVVDDDGRETTREPLRGAVAKPINLSQMKEEAYKVVRSKLKMQLNVPRAAVFTSMGRGLGVKNPEALYDTAKIVNMIDCINSSNEYCRISAFETLNEIYRNTGIHITDPQKNPSRMTSLHAYPLHYMEVARILYKLKSKLIVKNPGHTDSVNIPLFSFVATEMSQEGREAVFKKGLDNGREFMSQALPELTATETGRWEDSQLGHWLLGNEMPDRSGVKEVCIRAAEGWLNNREARSLGNALCRSIFNYRTQEWGCPYPVWDNESLLVNQDMLGVTHTDRWGTDGSMQLNGTVACYGLCVDEMGTVDGSSRSEGNQSVNKAEADAILEALLRTCQGHVVHVYTDSLVTLTGVETLFYGRGKAHRWHKDMANFSVLNTIAQVWKDRVRQGGGIEWHKVKAHTADNLGYEEILDLGVKLNKRADELAGYGSDRPTALRIPYHNGADAILSVKGEMQESSVYGVLYRESEKLCLEEARAKKGASKRLAAFDEAGLWKEAAPKYKRDTATSLFIFFLRFRNLGTPRNMDVTNKHLPLLFPDGKCVFCNVRKGTEYHIICKCQSFRAIRLRAFAQLERKLSNLFMVPNTKLDGRFQELLFPQNEGSYLYGDLSTGFRAVLVDWLAGKWGGRDAQEAVRHAENAIDKVARKIGKYVHSMYHEVWKGYGDRVSNEKQTLADRLQLTYGMDVVELGERHREMKREMREEGGRGTRTQGEG